MLSEIAIADPELVCDFCKSKVKTLKYYEHQNFGGIWLCYKCDNNLTTKWYIYHKHMSFQEFIGRMGLLY